MKLTCRMVADRWEGQYLFQVLSTQRSNRIQALATEMQEEIPHLNNALVTNPPDHVPIYKLQSSLRLRKARCNPSGRIGMAWDDVQSAQGAVATQ